MSEVKRYTAPYASVNEDEFGLYVRIDDYTQVQSELAALREELADREADVRAHAGRRIAAEQRNAALEALALLAFNSGEMTGWWCDRYAALIKPTESGASE